MIFMLGFNLKKLKNLTRSSKTKDNSAPFPVKRKPPVVVHIGNVGLSYENEQSCAKTRKFSKRFKDIKFIGIDLRKASSNAKNWVQMHTDALNGLKKLRNGSVSIIRSEMALGYYTEQKISESTTANLSSSVKYAQKVMEVAVRKLKPTGKLVIVADKDVAKELIKLSEKCGFKGVQSEFVTNEKATSYWTQRFDHRHYYGVGPRINFMVTLTFLK